ncbi:DUF397 domain-containing protein [Nonomuraea sp. NPDC050786]|uniref:DUF397 domain-containing protein n=1 Tax=Nonomuraea sp. NPDC050786 TaxID=3154840 RepID=UPI0033E69DC0
MDLELKREIDDAEWVTASSDNQGNCIYVAFLSGGRVAIRDSERPDLEPLVVRGPVWDAFSNGMKRGVFERPA